MSKRPRAPNAGGNVAAHSGSSTDSQPDPTLIAAEVRIGDGLELALFRGNVAGLDYELVCSRPSWQIGSRSGHLRLCSPT